MKKTITLLTLMFISIIGYADDFDQYKILPQYHQNTDHLYIQNVNMDNQYLALGKRQGELGGGLTYYNVTFNSVGTEIVLIRNQHEDGTFYLSMQTKDSGRRKIYQLAVLIDNGSQLVAIETENRIPYQHLFSAETLNENNKRVSWYIDPAGSIARSYHDGQGVLFDKQKVDNRDSRRWNFFIRYK